MYVTRTLNAAAGIVIDTAGLDLSNLRLRAAASQGSSTLSQKGFGGVRTRSEQRGSMVPGWRDGVKPSAINRSAYNKSVGEGIRMFDIPLTTDTFCVMAEARLLIGFPEMKTLRVLPW